MYRVGIDLGGTNIATGVVNENFQIVGRAVTKTNPADGPEDVVKNIEDSIHDAVADAGITLDDIESIGIGSPGTVDREKGSVEESCNLNFYGVPVVKMLRDKISKKVYIANGANMAAYGEYIAGAGIGSDIFVAVTLGTGVGSGIIIGGNIFDGCNYAGAELGHICIAMDGEICNCGNKGCWEAYASATALIKQTKRAMLDNPSSEMWSLCQHKIENVTGKTAFIAMRSGDEAGRMVVDNYCRYIAVGIRNIIEIFQPDIICIGGGISNQGEHLLQPIKKYVDVQYASRRLKKRTELRIAKLGNDAGIIGAAYLGCRECK